MQKLEEAKRTVKEYENESLFQVDDLDEDPIIMGENQCPQKTIAELNHFNGNTTVRIGNGSFSIELEWREAYALGRWLIQMFNYNSTIIIEPHQLGIKYYTDQRVIHDGIIYICNKDHISTEANKPFIRHYLKDSDSDIWSDWGDV